MLVFDLFTPITGEQMSSRKLSMKALDHHDRRCCCCCRWCCVWARVCVLLEGVMFMCFSNGTLPPWTCWGPGSPNAWISSSTSTSWRSSSGSQRWGRKHSPRSRHTCVTAHHPQSLLSRVEKVPGLPAAGGPRLHPQQQDVRHGAQQADLGGGHGFGEGRRHAGHLHEGQRRGGRRGRLEPKTRRLPNPSLPSIPRHLPLPTTTAPFTLLTLAWLPMHVPTQIATLGPLCQLEMPMKEL